MSVPLFRRSVAGVFVVVLSAAAAFAQNPPADAVRDTTVRELLEEVRLLRRVLQATGLGTVRAQILLAQRQGHHERVAQLQRQIADARSDAREALAEADRLQRFAAEVETSLTLEPDPAKRADRESQIRQLGSAQEQMKQRAASQRERELELAASLSLEEAALEEMQRALARLERELDELRQSVAPEAPPR